ncbi:hypothetical protein J6590_036460 [Homalodisca vitripennis]|nr:hypothetical protein J6590_036460 [Homalodisca vitripennis]
MAGQAGCLQGQGHSAVTHPSSSHARRRLIWLCCDNRYTRYTTPLFFTPVAPPLTTQQIDVIFSEISYHVTATAPIPSLHRWSHPISSETYTAAGYDDTGSRSNDCVLFLRLLHYCRL